MNVLVLTTSYPRWDGDAAGRFVADAVDRLRTHVDVEVVSAQSFRHFGIAYGHGVLGNLKRRPWLGALVPMMLGSFVHAARDAAARADVVHAHWLPAGWVAARTGKPFVVTLHGTDVELADRVPRLAHTVLRHARLVVAVSNAIAEAARRYGAADVRVIPNGVDVPPGDGHEAEPPYVLYAGRLSREKGILELAEAARGLPLVVVGDGPLRRHVPAARGVVPRAELEELYAGAAAVACPSRREGFGVTCLEAMAHGKPVVASAVGGLLDLVVDGETGLLVPPRDTRALRGAMETLLRDRDLRSRLGAAGRERARERFSWDAVVSATLSAYSDALAAQSPARTA
ncbi:MAG: glycosyltransferase family 4 protein [Actinobacteria bacterium]|nr:MAG: glycosyltransferase family 4 protein [Actinomycetota bacterium]